MEKDLLYVRNQMKKIMEFLSDENVTIEEKRGSINVYNTLNNSAKILVSTFATDLALEKYRTNGRK